MYDDALREPIKTAQVMFVTLREVIEGTLYHNENVRLSDELNAEAKQHSRYITLKDATIYSISTGREILKTAFLMVSHDHVIYMTPKGCVQMAATSTIQSEQETALQHAALQQAALQQASPQLPAWEQIPSPAVESEAALPGPSIEDEPKMQYHWGKDAGVMARHAVVHGTDAHLTSRQAMLEALAAIRSPQSEAPRSE